MAIFEYKARTREGEIRSGTIETSSSEAAVETLQQNNLIVLAMRERARRSIWNVNIKIPFKNYVSNKDIVIFSRQLSTLFEAKIPVVESLKTLIGETTKPALREAVAEVLDDIAGGLSISQAMSKHPQIFSSFYISLIRSGEESGKLQEVFSYLADYL